MPSVCLWESRCQCLLAFDPTNGRADHLAMDHLVENLKYLAAARGITNVQTHLAKVAGVNQSTISKFLRGIQSTDYRNVVAWANDFGVSIDALVSADMRLGIRTHPTASSDSLNEPFFYRAIQTVRTLFGSIPPHLNNGDEAGAVIAAYRALIANSGDPLAAVAAATRHLHIREIGGEHDQPSGVHGRGRTPRKGARRET